MNRRLRVLDLFCCAGGASAGYYAAGFDVVGVDIRPQPYYPFPFIQADALTVDLTGFDVIAASPPCQRFSAATPAHMRHEHPDLIEPTRERLRAAVAAPGGPWAYVMENVPGAPLLDPITICGDSLRLGVRRHRLFESNLPLTGTPCWHDRQAPPVPVYGSYGQRSGRKRVVDGETSPNTEEARAAMGIDWMPWPNLTQAIPPTYTHWIGVQLMRHRAADESRRRMPPGRDATPAPDGDATTAAVDNGCPAGVTQPRRQNDSDGSLLAVVPAAADVTPPAGLRHCHCGKPLRRPATGRWPRHCSHACRQAAYRTRTTAQNGEAA
ncbi:DNA cytosine methyltransferase [Micromonospora sp. NPDC049047]|uniref:DNA cytosine methyltransferase n=1 Tax=Micromonospora sp. NPDC049047 TaxID=3155645 RepID=UPI00340F53A6